MLLFDSINLPPLNVLTRIPKRWDIMAPHTQAYWGIGSQVYMLTFSPFIFESLLSGLLVCPIFCSWKFHRTFRWRLFTVTFPFSVWNALKFLIQLLNLLKLYLYTMKLLKCLALRLYANVLQVKTLLHHIFFSVQNAPNFLIQLSTQLLKCSTEVSLSDQLDVRHHEYLCKYTCRVFSSEL